MRNFFSVAQEWESTEENYYLIVWQIKCIEDVELGSVTTSPRAGSSDRLLEMRNDWSHFDAAGGVEGLPAATHVNCAEERSERRIKILTRTSLIQYCFRILITVAIWLFTNPDHCTTAPNYLYEWKQDSRSGVRNLRP